MVHKKCLMQFSREECFYQDCFNDSILMGAEMATWPFWVLYVTEPTGKQKNYNGDWGNLIQINRKLGFSIQ